MERESKMSNLHPGQRASVTRIETVGEMRRRFQDIGLVPNTEVRCIGKSPLGDPKAYKIRGAVMALRKKESDGVYIRPLGRRRIIGVAGNPNVGKSTLFNALTGMKQHTGNWSGKTVENAVGFCRHRGKVYELVDIPGCYSLAAHSGEEETARDFVCFAEKEGMIVVCDAVCLERNLNLVLQIMEAVPKVLVCVNLMDEAGKKKITIDLPRLSALLHTRVVGTSARSGQGILTLKEELRQMLEEEEKLPLQITYEDAVEERIKQLASKLTDYIPEEKRRWVSARLLEQDAGFVEAIQRVFSIPKEEYGSILEQCSIVRSELDQVCGTDWQDHMAYTFVRMAEEIAGRCVTIRRGSDRRDRKLDRIFTGKCSGFLVMLFFLMGIFWLTIVGANVPSRLCSSLLFGIEEWLWKYLSGTALPVVFCDFLLHGVYRVAAWVISVMLPPMAIFFPLFTLLEDFGYLPRIAFNLDRCFQTCHACGKQALTMMMGLGCNAVGVTGCRIIDSPRERLIAVLTNSLVPCNGRFPTLIALITMFFAGNRMGAASGILSAGMLTGVIFLGVSMTFLASALLSATILKGMPSAFTLELPPYRRPQIGKVLVRSVLDRTIFVLFRALKAAIPAGVILWIMANTSFEGGTLLSHFADFLDPAARMLGMDGVILMAFILGFPANEIVVPIMLMAYMAQGSLQDFSDLDHLKGLLMIQGWTWKTALCTMVFSLFHWPCATTCMTIRKETGKLRWVFLAVFLPAFFGISLCFLIHLL